MRVDKCESQNSASIVKRKYENCIRRGYTQLIHCNIMKKILTIILENIECLINKLTHFTRNNSSILRLETCRICFALVCQCTFVQKFIIKEASGSFSKFHFLLVMTICSSYSPWHEWELQLLELMQWIKISKLPVFMLYVFIFSIKWGNEICRVFFFFIALSKIWQCFDLYPFVTLFSLPSYFLFMLCG